MVDANFISRVEIGIGIQIIAIIAVLLRAHKWWAVNRAEGFLSGRARRKMMRILR